jgi:hypothetical protein
MLLKSWVWAISSVLLLLTASPIIAADHPQGNFVLAGGKYRSTDDASPYEKIDKSFFSSIIVPVKDGEINFHNTWPIDTEIGNQKFSGTIELSMKGGYDKDTGVINTNFTLTNDSSYERKTGTGIRMGKGTAVFSGTAKGTVIDNQVVLSFEGKLTSQATSEANDRHIDSTSSSGIPWVKKVAFGTSEWVEQQEEVAEEPEESGRDSGARASDLSGQVEIACPPDLEAWDVMKMGRVIYVNCHIKTGEDSKAVISFSDMTTFVVKPESEIVIDTPPEKDSKMKLLAGNIWANVKKMVKDGTMEVHMGQAVAGIKGTTFVLEESGGKSTLKVIEGAVAFKSKTTNDEKTVKSAEMLTATNTGLGEIKTFDVASENERWAGEVPKAETIDEAKVEPIVNEKMVSQNSQNIYIVPIGILAALGIGGFLFIKRN